MKNFFFGVAVGVGLTFLLLFLYQSEILLKQQSLPESKISLRQPSLKETQPKRTITRKESQPKRAITRKTISAADFEILSLRSEWEVGRFRVIGEIRNNGNIAAGVEVEAIARDSNGTLIESTKFWPNSISNIPPGSTTGVSYTITENRRASRVELKIVRVTVW